MNEEIIPEEEIALMPEDGEEELDPIDQYLLSIIDQLESEL